MCTCDLCDSALNTEHIEGLERQEGNLGEAPCIWQQQGQDPLSWRRIHLFPNIPPEASGGTRGGAGEAPTQRGPGLLMPRQQALPDSGLRSRGRLGGAPRVAFQLLLHNLSISCPGCKFQPFPSQATSGL